MSLALEIMEYANSIRDFDSKERKMFMDWAIQVSYLESNAQHNGMYFDGHDVKVYVKENKDTGYADVRIETPRTSIQGWMRTYGDKHYKINSGYRYYDLVSIQNKVGVSDIVADIYGIEKKIPSISGLKTMALSIISNKTMKDDDRAKAVQ
jgi:hypothetical protein